MASFLKTLWDRLAGGPRSGEPADAPAPAVEYKGYRIRPAPYLNNGQYQTAGTIEKDSTEGLREHRFVRAESHASRDDAVAFATAKAKQIIDQQGDRIFGPPSAAPPG